MGAQKREVFADRLAATANTSRQRRPSRLWITQAMGHFRAVLNNNLNQNGHKSVLRMGVSKSGGKSCKLASFDTLRMLVPQE